MKEPKNNFVVLVEIHYKLNANYLMLMFVIKNIVSRVYSF